MLEFTEYTKILIGLLAIVNPIGAVPVFVSLTMGVPAQERKRIANIVVVTVSSVLLIALILGEVILGFFGISINSFRVAGGILLLLIAISMLHARISPAVSTKEETHEGESKESVAVVPLSMPLLAGPGAISTVILYAHKETSVWHYMIIGADIIIVGVILWMVLSLIPWITRHISQTGLNIFTRIMGLLLAAIAIEFMANGLKGLFPVLA